MTICTPIENHSKNTSSNEVKKPVWVNTANANKNTLKITADIIKGIKKGTSSTFKVGTPRDLNTARSLASYVSRIYPELGAKYSCVVNYAKNEVTITANPVSKKR